MKKYSYFVFLFVFFSFTSTAQIHSPVKWTHEIKQVQEGIVDIYFTASLAPNWRIYAASLPKGHVPEPTFFDYTKNSYLVPVGILEEVFAPKEKFDVTFGAQLAYFEKEAVFKQRFEIIKAKNTPIVLEAEANFMACNDLECLPPDIYEFKIQIDTKTFGVSHVLPGVTQTEKRSIWGILIAGFLGGLLALMTPCVFPMIPLTVSFFTKSAKNRKKGIANAMLYAFFIIFIYVVLGMLITLGFGADALNSFASDAYVNLLFFIIFLVFAASFLGLFEITLPSSWINKVDNASDKGGVLGIFFMAFALSLVSFSCTGPIIGTLLVEAAILGNYIFPIAGMFGFSLALALPFGFFALFPSFLNALPKSGSWLNHVKITLGLMEIALALKFLSNVDLAYHWNILTREIFVAIWLAIFLILAAYFLGKIKLGYATESENISVPRLGFAILSLAFVFYLLPGMFGAPLRYLSGILPPEYHNEGWKTNSYWPSKENIMAAEAGASTQHTPHNLPIFKDYEQGLSYAKKVNKPIFLDFTGFTCVNCRKMEDNIWSDPRILSLLQNDLVMISLYVDDKTTLPFSEQYVSPVTGKKVKTVGNKWSDFQSVKYKTNSQPFYVIIDLDEKALTPSIGYTPDVTAYLNFLQKGIDKFKK